MSMGIAVDNLGIEKNTEYGRKELQDEVELHGPIQQSNLLWFCTPRIYIACCVVNSPRI
jgi:hypothetical protein